MVLRRATDRRDGRRRTRANWLTLSLFSEHHLRPGEQLPPPPPHDTELLTYVHEGALAYSGATGRSGRVQAGEFQRTTGHGGIARNRSRTASAHVVQIAMRPSRTELVAGDERKRFSAGERRGALRVVASHDGRGGSLHLAEEALVFSARLHPGQHIVHALGPHRAARLFVLAGALTLGEVVLTSGDEVCVTAERAVSFTARAETEVLLVDAATGGA